MAPTFVGFVDLSLICLRASRVQPQQVRRPQSFPSVSLGQVWGWRALPVQNPEHRLGEGAITAGTPAPKFPRCRLVKWGAGVRYRYNTQSTGWEKVHLLQVRRPQSFRRCRLVKCGAGVRYRYNTTPRAQAGRGCIYCRTHNLGHRLGWVTATAVQT